MKLTTLLLAFYMFIGSLIPRTDFSQLVHLGDLKNHYLAHQVEAESENQNISFIEFCYIHFIDSSQHSEDHHEEDHQQLPLQTINSIVVLGIVHYTIPLYKKAVTNFTSLNYYVSPFHLMGFADTSHQPPNY